MNNVIKTNWNYEKQRYIDQFICFIGEAFCVLPCTHYQTILLSVKFYSDKHIFFKYNKSSLEQIAIDST